MDNYYAGKLNAGNLLEVYNTGIGRVRGYLEAEIDFICSRLHANETVLELGTGYGRIMKRIAPFAKAVVGIDISNDSIAFGRDYLKGCYNCTVLVMDAHGMAFDGEYDVVLCLQNGLSAMKGDPYDLVERSMKALVPGGRAFFSTYASGFWEWRLEWFKEQAGKGLLGELDMKKTGKGRIVCSDGFTATTFSEEDLEAMGKKTGCPYSLQMVDESSLFLIIEKN